MNTNEMDAVELQRQRRKRINRIKSAIVFIITFWIIASLLAIVILSVQVALLNKRVKNLEQAVSSGITIDSPSPGNTGTTEKDNSEKTTENNDRFANLVTGIDTEDNMASETDAHEVYLTFDCVPGDVTNQILDILKLYNVKATFFVTGDESEEAQAIYKRIVAEGHTLGMHSYSNQYSDIYGSVEDFAKDYTKISDYLYKVTGLRCKYYRFPGGSGNQISNVNMAEFAGYLKEQNITYFDWNVAAADTASDYTSEQVVTSVIEGIEQYKTSVVLLHDDESKSTTALALGTLIEQLQAKGATILPIDENTKIIQYIHADSID